MRCSSIINSVYTYLGYRNIQKDDTISSLIEEMLQEVEELSQFKYIFKEQNTMLPFMVDNIVYSSFLEGCNSYLLILTTLGKRIDDRCKYYSKVDQLKMCVFDACSNAYLEYMADEFENKNFPNERTYRFCPGYQGTSTVVLKDIFEIVQNQKAGVYLNDSYLMIPLKSMCGIIGIGKKAKKACGNCALLDKCVYRKEGTRCY